MLQLPYTFAKRHRVVLRNFSEDSLTIACLSDCNPTIALELQRVFQKPLQFDTVDLETFEHLLAKSYESGTASAMEAISDLEEGMDLEQLMDALPKAEDLLEKQDDAPVIQLINAILGQAIKQQASDIHFEISEDRLLVRFRLDGVLQEILEPPRVFAPLLISRLKVMAKLNIAERRLPQDGRISIKIAGRGIDLRVSTIPTHYGERIVLRLLDKKSAPLDLLKLGMSPDTLSLMRDLIAKPHGIILVTGPTGSGKTTTLYAAITELNNSQRNILTIEDPIEYYLPGIGQTQVNNKVGMTFAKGLRAILRQDPDIVMVGEIRDKETADMAIQASLTGHLVFSTLHTNSAVAAITRLRDIGVEPFLLSSTIIGVLAQRLVRLLCPACKVPEPISNEHIRLGIVSEISEDSEIHTIYKPKGCDACHHSGYQGRSGIYELVAINDSLRDLVHEQKGQNAMETEARKRFPSMRRDGWSKVLKGETSIEEVLRVTSEK